MTTWGEVFRHWFRQSRNMAPSGVITVTSMTVDEVKAASRLFDAAQASRRPTTFKDVLWLTAQRTIVHWQGAVHRTMCGLDALDLPCTDDPRAVTCAHCRRFIRRLGVD